MVFLGGLSLNFVVIDNSCNKDNCIGAIENDHYMWGFAAYQPPHMVVKSDVQNRRIIVLYTLHFLSVFLPFECILKLSMNDFFAKNL